MDFTEYKKIVLDALFSQLSKESIEGICKEFSLNEEQLEKLSKKIFDSLLTSPDLVSFLGEAMNIYPVKSVKKQKAHYIG